MSTVNRCNCRNNEHKIGPSVDMTLPDLYYRLLLWAVYTMQLAQRVRSSSQLHRVNGVLEKFCCTCLQQKPKYGIFASTPGLHV